MSAICIVDLALKIEYCHKLYNYSDYVRNVTFVPTDWQLDYHIVGIMSMKYLIILAMTVIILTNAKYIL